jgi:hypothetical protein
LLHATIFLDDKKITYFRSYENLLNILGSITGLFELLVVLAGLIFIPITKLSQNTVLVNSIFSFENQNANLTASMLEMKGSQIVPEPKSSGLRKSMTLRSVAKLMENPEQKTFGQRKLSLVDLK